MRVNLLLHTSIVHTHWIKMTVIKITRYGCSQGNERDEKCLSNLLELKVIS